MGEFNDGKAFAYQSTGESRMIFDKTVKVTGSIVHQGLATTLGLTTLNQSLDCVSGMVDPLAINGVLPNKKRIVQSRRIDEKDSIWCYTVVDSAVVRDESYESAGMVHGVGTVVAGTTFDTSFVSWHMKPIILKKMSKTNVSLSTTVPKMRYHYSNVGDKRKIHPLVPLDTVLTANVYMLPEQYLIKNGSALSDDNQTIGISVGGNILEPVSAQVEDYKPPTWGNTGSGSGVKNMIIIVQKYTFSEIFMAFDDTKIIDVQGLPQGMTYDNQYIKGSPLASGLYNVKVKLDNLRTLEITMQIPELPRQL